MPRFIRIGGVLFRVRCRKAFERIGRPYRSILNTVCLQNGAHKNRGSALPDTRLYQVSRNPVSKSLLDTHLEVVKPLQPDHRVSRQRQVSPDHSNMGIEWNVYDKPNLPLRELRNNPPFRHLTYMPAAGRGIKLYGRRTPNVIGKTLLHQIQIQGSRVVPWFSRIRMIFHNVFHIYPYLLRALDGRPRFRPRPLDLGPIPSWPRRRESTAPLRASWSFPENFSYPSGTGKREDRMATKMKRGTVSLHGSPFTERGGFLRYAILFRCLLPYTATPMSPIPRRSKVEGSGTRTCRLATNRIAPE